MSSSLEFMLKHFDKFHILVKSYAGIHNAIMSLPHAYDRAYRKLLYISRRDIEFWYQRKTRGWDDSETWSMRNSIAEYILPRLEVFKENSLTPHGMTDEEWQDALDKMIWTFRFAASDKSDVGSNADYKRAQVGLNLFAKHYWALWY